MGRESKNRNHRRRRPFQPEGDERLEDRAFLSALSPAAEILRARSALIARAGAISARRHNVQGFTAAGGQARVVTDGDGERFRVEALKGGSVRVQTASNGRAAIVVQGSREFTELEIRPQKVRLQANSGHFFGPRQPYFDGMLNVALLDMSNGEAQAIYGYGTTILSGPLTVGGQQTVDRIALAELRPGASIRTGADLGTLDIYKGVHLSGAGTGIFIGRDLNAFNVTGDVVLEGGAQIVVGRDVGREAQGPNGTGPGGQGIAIKGNLVIGEGSSFVINRDLGGTIVIFGDLIGASRIQINGVVPPGSITVLGNVVA